MPAQKYYNNQLVKLAREYMTQHTLITYEILGKKPSLVQEVGVHPFIETRVERESVVLAMGGLGGIMIHRDAEKQGATVRTTTSKIKDDFAKRYTQTIGELGEPQEIQGLPGFLFEDVKGGLSEIVRIVYDTVVNHEKLKATKNRKIISVSNL